MKIQHTIIYLAIFILAFVVFIRQCYATPQGQWITSVCKEHKGTKMFNVTYDDKTVTVLAVCNDNYMFITNVKVNAALIAKEKAAKQAGVQAAINLLLLD